MSVDVGAFLPGSDLRALYLSPMRGRSGAFVWLLFASSANGCGSSGDDAMGDQPETSVAETSTDAGPDATTDSTMDSATDTFAPDTTADARDSSALDATADDGTIEADVVADDGSDAMETDVFVDDATDTAETDATDAGPPPVGHALRIGMTTHDGTVVTIVGSSLPSATTDVDGAYWMATPTSGTYTMTFANGPYEQTAAEVTFVSGLPFVDDGHGSLVRLDELTLPRAHRLVDVEDVRGVVLSKSRRWIAAGTVNDDTGVERIVVGSPVGAGPGISFVTTSITEGASFSEDDRYFVTSTAHDATGAPETELVTLATGAINRVAGFVTPSAFANATRLFTHDGTRVVLLRPIAGTPTEDVVTVTTDVAHTVTAVASSADNFYSLTDDDAYVLASAGGRLVLAPSSGGPSIDLGCRYDDARVVRPQVVACEDTVAHTLTVTSLPSLAKKVIATGGTISNTTASPRARWIAWQNPSTSKWHLEGPTGSSLDVPWYTFAPDDSVLLHGDLADATGKKLMKTVGGVTTMVDADAAIVAFTPDSTRVLLSSSTGALKIIPLTGGATVPLVSAACVARGASFSDDGSKVLVGCASECMVGRSDGSAPLVSLGIAFQPQFALSPDGARFVVDGNVRTFADPLAKGVALLPDAGAWDYTLYGTQWADSTHVVFVETWLAAYPGRYNFERAVYVASDF